jgi:hypothetical protein
VTGTWPQRPGELYGAVATPQRIGSGVVGFAVGSEDGLSVEATVYGAFGLHVRLVEGGAEATLLTPEAVQIPAVAGPWRKAAAEVTENALRRARDQLPERYLRWHESRAAMPREVSVHDGPDVASLDDVRVLLTERFEGVMSDPRVERAVDAHTLWVRLYDRIELATGLERPRGNFFRSVSMPTGGFLHAFPGEGRLGTTPGSIRRAFRALDEYCRARLDLPARTDDEETP